MEETQPVAKRCGSCGLEKPISEFYRDASQKDGLYRRCKSCHRLSTEVYRKRNMEQFAETSRRWRKNNPEKAKIVSREAAARAYARNPDKQKARTKAWYAENKERAAVYHQSRRIERKAELSEWFREYYKRNADVIKARTNKYSKDNRERLRSYNAARVMKRHALKKQSIPKWADLEAIKGIYMFARKLERETGIPHHVDHIVPLQSDLVCGLHVESNLRVVTRAQNQSKGNRYWDCCPDNLLRD